MTFMSLACVKQMRTMLEREEGGNERRVSKERIVSNLRSRDLMQVTKKQEAR